MGFSLEITSVEELIQFLSILKGESLDREQIVKLTNDLNAAVGPLVTAESTQPKSAMEE